MFVIFDWHAYLMYFRQTVLTLFALMCPLRLIAQQPAALPDPYLELMKKAAQHASASEAPAPVLSPIDFSVIHMGETKEDTTLAPITQLHAMGIRVVPWTTNAPDSMRKIIESGADGLITDRPDILQTVLAEQRGKASSADREQLKHFDVSAHRGGRRLRPENTLPSFESGLDQLSTTLETDTGVSTDHVSTIWHDQFYNPDSCRRADGKPYTMENRVYLSDISLKDAQTTFICDRLRFAEDQKNDLSLSPVSVAFAHEEHLINPYVPTYVDQLFRFVAFYVEYYRKGPGKNLSKAAEMSANAERVRFNIETKIMPPISKETFSFPSVFRGEKLPPELFLPNHTVSPEVFVNTLAGTVMKYHMESRVEIQSFDFRTLQLVESKFPKIQTYYLTMDSKLFYTEFVPLSLRLAATE
jgi:glycerophosphoryl diester phosphodiesterase